MFDKTTHYKPILDTCENVLQGICCDFVGFAFQKSIGPDITWHVAAGNNNEKYKLITVRYGKGIAGRVISTGSSITIQDFPHDITGKALEYPIMLAERLIYSFAVPVNYKGVPKGVLLVGKRKSKPLSEVEKHVVLQSARRIEDIISV